MPGAVARPRCPAVSLGKEARTLGTPRELLAAGKYLEAAEMALYGKFLDKLDAGSWVDCFQIVRLLEGLSII